MLYREMRARWTPTAPAIGFAWGDERDGHTHTDWPQGALYTYRELEGLVDQARGWLRLRNLKRGDTLALQLPRGLQLLQLVLACMAEGVTVLPLNRAYTAREVRFFLEDSGAARACLLDGLARQLLEDDPPCPIEPAITLKLTLAHAPKAPSELPEVPDDQGLLLFYTSGTTGRPKGALSTHANIATAVRSLHQAWRWSAEDVLLHALPLFHVHGLVVAQFGALWAGAQTWWVERFEASAVLRELRDKSATVFMGVPTFYNRLLQQPACALPALRLMTSGSAPLPAAVHQAIRARFGQTILERYGMSEVGIVLSNPYDGERRPGSVGFPLPHVTARVAREDDTDCAPGEVGEIRIAGPSVMQGYIGLPDKTAQALAGGEMHTGDLGFVSEDGYFHVVGRSSDMVITGGLNVYPREVEAALLEHPAVLEAAIVGVPHPDWGEQVVGQVVLSEPTPEAELLAFLRERVAGFKCPKQLRAVDELPRNAMGKVQKARIRASWA